MELDPAVPEAGVPDLERALERPPRARRIERERELDALLWFVRWPEESADTHDEPRGLAEAPPGELGQVEELTDAHGRGAGETAVRVEAAADARGSVAVEALQPERSRDEVQLLGRTLELEREARPSADGGAALSALPGVEGRIGPRGSVRWRVLAGSVGRRRTATRQDAIVEGRAARRGAFGSGRRPRQRSSNGRGRVLKDGQREEVEPHGCN